MKRIKYIALLLLLSLLCACGGGAAAPSPGVPSSAPTASLAPAPSQTAASDPSTPLLWKVTGKGSGGTLYLFGAIHVGTASMYPLPKAVMDAYEASDALAVECDIVSFQADLSQMAEYTAAFQYPAGDKVTNHLSPQGYEKIEAFLQAESTYGDALSLFQSYNLAFWSSLVDEVLLARAELQSDLGLDTYFLNLALKDKAKEVLEVESLSFQFQMLADVPDALQEYLILQTIQAPEEEVSSLKALYEAVRTGDEKKLNQMLFEGDELDTTLTEQQQKTLTPLMEAYQKTIYTDRNAHMADTAKGYLDQGRRVFFVVGMAHMLGEDGLVASLRSMGYTVTPVETGAAQS